MDRTDVLAVEAENKRRGSPPSGWPAMPTASPRNGSRRSRSAGDMHPRGSRGRSPKSGVGGRRRTGYHHAPLGGCISKTILEPGVPSVISHVLDLMLDNFEFGPDLLAVAGPLPEVIVSHEQP